MLQALTRIDRMIDGVKAEFTTQGVDDGERTP